MSHILTDALCQAAREGDTPALAGLALAGADPNVRDTRGRIPLWFAIRAKQVPVTGALLAAGAEADTVGWVGNGGDTLLHLNARVGEARITKMLLDHGADPNRYDDGLEEPDPRRENVGSMTALHAAVEANRIAVVDVLIECGAYPEAQTTDRGERSGETPLMMAILAGQEEMVALFLACGANTSQPRRDGLTPAVAAASRPSTKILSALADAGVDLVSDVEGGWTALHAAAAAGRASSCSILIEAGARMDARTVDARSIASRQGLVDYPAGSTPMGVARLAGRDDVVAVLEESGARE